MNPLFFPIPRKFANSLISLSIIFIWTLTILIMAYPGEEEVADELGLAFYTYYTLFFGLCIGLIASTIRLIGFIKEPSSFLYNFTGVLNTCLGLLGIILVLTNQLDQPWVLLFMFSLGIGLTIMFDIFTRKDSQQHSHLR